MHQTRNNPKTASAVIMDMSGSMRHGGQYIACKKMAMARTLLCGQDTHNRRIMLITDGLPTAHFEGEDLDRFVLWDYLQQKRRVIG